MFVGFVTQLFSPSNVCAWSIGTHCVHKQSSLSDTTMLSAAVLSALDSSLVVLSYNLAAGKAEGRITLLLTRYT